ncbi:MAG: hypothetical protein J1D87_10815 [Lachnospiraceae bacterium]|nr:hypothetical protein [Lachnospiraceae bacterium]
MPELVWGKDEQLCFANQDEYYYSLGLLCNSNWFNIVYEPNKSTKSWENAYRIQCANCPVDLPKAFQNALRSQKRINNNDYVENLINNHNFVKDGNKYISGNYSDVRKTVPDAYLTDFDAGYNQ